MTPAINTAKKQNVEYRVHEYTHDASAESYGTEAAEKLQLSEARVFKTLVVMLDDKELAVAVIPVSSMLSMKLMAKACGAKKAAMADKTLVERSTGYVLGGVSPLGQRKRLTTVIDCSAQDFATVFISAGRRGLEIELAPQDLQRLSNALLANLCQ